MIYWYLQYNNVAIRAMRVGIDNLIQSVKSDGFGESWHPYRQMCWVFLVSALCIWIYELLNSYIYLYINSLPTTLIWLE